MKRYLVLGLVSLGLMLSGVSNAAQQRDRDRGESRERQREGASEWRDLDVKAPGKQWVLLAEKEVNFRDDRDRIRVGDVGRQEGRFKQLQIRVDDAPVEIRRMVVTFENGETFDAITQRKRFDDESRALVVDLPGERRNIKAIDIDYFSVSQREGRGKLLVYAR
jgi:hypothetical protein